VHPLRGVMYAQLEPDTPARGGRISEDRLGRATNTNHLTGELGTKGGGVCVPTENPAKKKKKNEGRT